MGVAQSSHYVFTRSMLATWAGCCVLFGASLVYVGANQGWFKLNKAENSHKPSSVSDDKSAELIATQLMQSPAARECLDNPDEWKRVPFFWLTSEEMRKAAFLPGTLHAPNRLGAEPICFMNRDRKQFVTIMHIGKYLCGHEGIVHGGVQAALFDEITARPAFWNSPLNVALTASLKINYRRPAIADQLFVVRTQLKEMDGRKAVVTAQLEDKKGNILSDAEALYITPKDDSLVPDQSAFFSKMEDVYPGRF
ncbi:hypothetical protein IWW36_003053 [Coemansia brasiliensis]|uniref:Thioesterase domain-containing protein n=1 Tax=Coemansia brasiliensis TaxID=2650707 RepID=A0A9W8IDJ8_9FUNG|nr:hypothetical protein IWW36_003053 [Coemansia brasiliensis]